MAHRIPLHQRRNLEKSVAGCCPEARIPPETVAGRYICTFGGSETVAGRYIWAPSTPLHHHRIGSIIIIIGSIIIIRSDRILT